MSAKHKRPFVVFAAVALICGMVLFTGVRSKADFGRPDRSDRSMSSGASVSQPPELQGPATLGPSQEADDPDAEGGSSETSGTSDPSDFGTAPTDDDGSGSGDGDGAFEGSIVGQPQPQPDDGSGDDEAGPQDDEGKRDGKGRGGRGKNDKDEQNDNVGDNGPDEDEPVETDNLPDAPVEEPTLPESDLETP